MEYHKALANDERQPFEVSGLFKSPKTSKRQDSNFGPLLKGERLPAVGAHYSDLAERQGILIVI